MRRIDFNINSEDIIDQPKALKKILTINGEL